MNQTLCENIAHYIAKDNIKIEEPMSKHTTFRVGGPCKALVQVTSEKELTGLLTYLSKLEESYFILGNGSNLLVSDYGYDGVVIQLAGEYQEISVIGQDIYAGAGVKLSAIARVAKEHGLTGFEFAAGIPGTLGGALVMNAGAYGGEMKQVVKRVDVMSKDGNTMELSNEDMEFAYRSSILKKYPYIALRAVIHLEAGKEELIQEKMDDLMNKRKEKQPLEYPSAGSTFKRPEGNFAGKLIMDAGLRGFSVGDAQISEKHCGFVINKGNATATDIDKLMHIVQDRVEEQYQVRLEPEIIRIGQF